MIFGFAHSASMQGLALFAQQEGAAKGDGPAIPFYVPLLGIGILFYFLLVRPERRKRADQDKLLDKLQQNDQIVTIGGIFGRIVSLDKESIVIRLEDNAKVRILRSAVARVVSENRTEQE